MAGTRIEIRLNGVAIAYGRFNSATIRETMGPAPNTGSLVLNTTAPLEGETIQILATDESPDRVLFAGEIQTVTQTYDLQARNVRYNCTLIDRTFYANKRRPFGTFTGISASTVAAALALYAPECTTFGVAASLPSVTINFDGSAPFLTAWFQLVTAIGGVGGLSYLNDLRLALVDTGEAVDPVDLAHPPYNNPPVAISWDLAQVRTRMYGKGLATTTVLAAAVGATVLAVADASMFGSASPASGQLILGRSASAAQTDVYTYLGHNAGGKTTATTTGDQSISPGTPSAAEPSPRVIGRMVAGTYGYKTTFDTAAGRSIGSGAASVTVADVSTSNVGGAPTQTTGGSLTLLGVYSWAWTITTANGETGSVTTGSPITLTGGNNALIFNSNAYSDARILRVNIYRSKAGGSTLYLVGSISVASTNWTDTTADSAMGSVIMPTSSTAGGAAASLTSIATSGDSRVNARTLWRTAVGGSLYFKLATIGDNTTTTFVDTAADTALGEALPATSTIAVPVGATSIPITNLALIPAAGFLTFGTQVVSYTGRSASSGAGTVTGIPASGSGSIVDPIAFASVVTITPQIAGIGINLSPDGLIAAVGLGSTVALWVQRDDTSAQAALGLLESKFHGSPSDGIREDHFFDGRMGLVALTAACDAKLADFSRPIVGLTYSCDDLKTRCGATVHFDLSSYDAAVLALVPTGWWKLGESTGTVAADSGSGAQSGTYSGGVTLGQTGPLADQSTAVLFNGSSGKVAIASVAVPLSVTFLAWVKFTITAVMPVISNRHGGASNGSIYFGLNAGKVFTFFNDTGTSLNTGAAINDGAWHLIGMTTDGITTRNYVDGAQVGSLGMVRVAKAAAALDLAFDFTNTEYFAGTATQMSVFASVLTAGQMAALYALRTAPGFALAGDFTIQEVTKSFIGRADRPIVRHAVRASSSLFTLRDVIRLAQLTVP